MDLAEAGERLDPAGRSREAPRPRRPRSTLDEVRRVQPSLAEAAILLSHDPDRVDAIDTDYLLPPVKRRPREVGTRARVAPRATPAAAPRRPCAFPRSSAAKARATTSSPCRTTPRPGPAGGIILFWGILTAEDGKIDLDDLRPVRRLNDGIKDRFPVAERDPVIDAPEDWLRRYSRYDPAAHVAERESLARLPRRPASAIASLFPQATDLPIDGIVRVDPYGLAALLELTGPVEVDRVAREDQRRQRRGRDPA